MPSFLTKVFGRKRDGGDEYSGSRSGDGELLDGKFEDVSPSISPSVAHFPELQTNGSPRGRGTERTHSDSRLRTFFRSRSRPASPTRQQRKADELPSLPLNLFAQDAPAFEDSQLLLSDKVIGERKLTPVEVVGLVKACSQAISNRGVETLGIMNPHWYSASPDVQRRLISLFIHSLTTKSPLTGLPSFKSEINDTRSPHDVAAVLRWGLRHIQLQGSGLGRNEDWYQTFFEEERKAEYPPKAFSQTLAPLIPSEHLELLQEVLEIFSSLGAHAETNSTSGSKLSKIFGLWILNAHRVESKDDWRSFYERWEVAGRQLEHVFFARIRDEAVENRVPTRLTDLVRRYPFYQDSNSPTTDLRLLPRSGFSTRVHHALLVRLDSELPNAKFRPKSKVHPLQLIAEALSTTVDDTEYAGLWKKIVDVSKAEGTGTSLSRIFSDETIRFLSLLPNDGADDGKSPASSLLPLSPSSPRAKRLSFSLSEFTDEIKRTNSTQSKSTAASPSPLSPLTADADWSLFATSGFGNSPTLTPLTSALFSASGDVERTSPPSRRPSGHSKHSSGAPRKSVEFSPAVHPEDAKQTTFPSKIALLQIVQLDEAFIDFWSDALLDPISADWPAFVVCRITPTLVRELKFAPAEGQEKTLEWVVLEQGYTVKAPPPSVPETASSAVAEHTERPSSPQSVGKKRFSFWSPSRTGSFASSIGSTSRKSGKKSGAFERGQRVSEMGEVVEEDAGRASASGAPLTSIRSAASTIGGGRTRKFRTPAAEDVVRVRIPSPRRKSADVKSLDATVTSKKSTETPTEGTSGAVAAAAAVVGGAVAVKEKEEKITVEEPVAEKAEETKPTVEEKVAAPAEDVPTPVIVKEDEVAAIAVEEPTPVVEAMPVKAEVVEQEDTSARALPVEDVPPLVEEVVAPAPEAHPAPVVEEEKPVPAEEKKEPIVEEKATPVVVKEATKVPEVAPTPAKEPTNGSVSASDKAKEKEKAVTSPEPASVIPRGAVKSLLARFQGKKDKKEKERAAPSPAEKKTAAPPPVPVKEKVEEKKVEEVSSSPSGSTAAAVVAAGAVAGVAAGIAAVAAKKAEEGEEVVENAATAPVPAAEPEAEPTPVVETKPAEEEEEVAKPAEVQVEETKPVEAQEQEVVAVAEPTAEDIPVPEESQEVLEAEAATARQIPVPEESSQAAKGEEESAPAEEAAVAVEALVAVEEETVSEVPAPAVAESEAPAEEISAPAEEAAPEAVAEPEAEAPPAVTVVQATPEDEEVPASVVEDNVSPVEEVTEVEAIPQATEEVVTSPAAAEGVPTPEVVKDEEPTEEAKSVVVEEKEAIAVAEETAVEEAADPVVPEEPAAPIEEATEVAATEEPAPPAVAEEEAIAVPANEEVAEGAVGSPVGEIPVAAEAHEADVEEKQDVVESTPAPSEVVAGEPLADVETKEEPTEVEAAQEAPAQDEVVAAAAQATIPVVEEPEETVEASAEPALETVPVAGGGLEISTEAKEEADPVETTAAQNGPAPSLLDTPVLDTQDRSVSEASSEAEDTTKQDQPEATTDPLVESHTVVTPDNQPPHDPDATKEPLANTGSAAEREAEDPRGEAETIQEAAESSVELHSTDEDTAAVEIKATTPEPRVVPATEESIIEVSTESGDGIVTVDGDSRQVAEVSESPTQVPGVEDSEVTEEAALVEEDHIETEETTVPDLDSLNAAASDGADLPANHDIVPQTILNEGVVANAATGSALAPEESTVKAESNIATEGSTLESQSRQDAVAEPDEDPANKAAESELTEKEPPREPIPVPSASTFGAEADSTVAEPEDTLQKDEAVIQVGTPKDTEGLALAANEEPEDVVMAAASLDAESHAEEENVPSEPVQDPSSTAETDKNEDEAEVAAPEQTIVVAADTQDEAPDKADVSPESGALDAKSTDPTQFSNVEAGGNADPELQKPGELKDASIVEDSREDDVVEDGKKAEEGEGTRPEVDVDSETPTKDGAAEEQSESQAGAEDAQTSEEVEALSDIPVVAEEEASEGNVPATEETSREAEELITAPSGGEATTTADDDEPHVSAFETVLVEEDDEQLPSAEGMGSAGSRIEAESASVPEALGEAAEAAQEEDLVFVEEATEQQPVKLDEPIVPVDQESLVPASDDNQERSTPQVEHGATEADRPTAETRSIAETGRAGEDEARVAATEFDSPTEPLTAVDEKQAVEIALGTETTPSVKEPSAVQTEPVEADETEQTQEAAAANEDNISSVLSSVPHMEPLDTKDDDPSNVFVNLPPVPLAEAPFVAATASEHALVPVADLSDDLPDSHHHHPTATALPPAIEHTLDVGSTPSAEALLDAVQGHEGHSRTLAKISADKLTVDVEDLHSSPTEPTDAVAEATHSDHITSSTIPIIQTEDAPDDDTKHVPAPLDLRLAETLAVAQDLPSAIEQAAVAGLTPEALLDAVQATLSATVFAPEPAVPTNTAQNDDGKEAQANEPSPAPVLNGNGHHHVPAPELSLATEEPKEPPVGLATTLAEEIAQPTETAVDLEKQVETLATAEAIPPVETHDQDAVTTTVGEKAASAVAESVKAPEEEATAHVILATSGQEEEASITPTAGELSPRQVDDDPNATDERAISTTDGDPQQTVAPDAEHPTTESAPTGDEQDGTNGAVEELPVAHGGASTAEAEGAATSLAETESSNPDRKVFSPTEEQTLVPADDSEVITETKASVPTEEAPSTTEENVPEGEEGGPDVRSDNFSVVDEDSLAALDGPASVVDQAEVGVALAGEIAVETPAISEPEVVEPEAALPVPLEEAPATSDKSLSATVDEQSPETEVVGGLAAEEETSVEKVGIILKPEVDQKIEVAPLPAKDHDVLLESEAKVDVAEDVPVHEEEDALDQGVQSEKDADAITPEPQDGTIGDKSLLSAAEPVESEVVDLATLEGSVNVDVVGEDEPSTSIAVEQKEASTEAAALDVEVGPTAAIAELENSTAAVSSEADSNPSKSTPSGQGKDADTSVAEGEENVKPTAGAAEGVEASTGAA